MLKHVQELRGIAVLAVIIFHLEPEILPNGYLGVDIFFLISGFIITRKLNDIPIGNFRSQLFDFMRSRVQRLMPSVSVLIIVVSIFSILLQDPIGTQQSTSKAGIASIFGLANLYFSSSSLDYFGAPAQSNPFLHMWSLGVEYQFYLIFPLMFIPTKKFSKNIKIKILSIILITSLAGAVLSEQLVDYTNASSQFYNPCFRIWEFIAGSILSLSGLTLRVSLGTSRLIKCSICAGLIFLRSELGFTWALTLVILLISSIGLVSSVEESNRSPYSVLGRIGDKSFSLYLWHWPVIVFAKYFFDGVTFLFVAIFLTATTTQLAFRYVESNRTLRFINRGFLRPLIAWLLLPFVISAAYGLVASEVLYSKYETGEYAKSLKGQVGNVSKVEELKNYKICNSAEQYGECAPTANENRILLVGDSHAGVLASGLASGLQASQTAKLTFYYTNGLTQTLEQDDLKSVHEHIKASSYSVVILAANWDRLGISDHLNEFLKSTSIETELLLIEDNPLFPFNAYRCAYGLSQILANKRCETPKEANLALSREIVGIDNLSKIDTKELFCKEQICSMKRNKEILYFDSNHLNENGARILTRLILEHLFKKY